MTSRIFVKEGNPGGKCTGTAPQSTTVLGRTNRAPGIVGSLGLYGKLVDNELENQRSFDVN
jgi:hypothetical protein